MKVSRIARVLPDPRKRPNRTRRRGGARAQPDEQTEKRATLSQIDLVLPGHQDGPSIVLDVFRS